MDFLDQVFVFSVSGRVLFGLLCLIFASWCRFYAVINNALWHEANQPVLPSLVASGPPLNRAAAGVQGCLFASLLNLVALLLFLIGIDQIVFAGGFTNFAWQFVR